MTEHPEPGGTLTLRGEPADAVAARRYAVTCCVGWGLYDARDMVSLVVSELVTNAVRHAHGPIRLRLTLTPATVLVEVDDPVHGRPHAVSVGQLAEGGRGLALVDAVAQRWGVTPLGGGKRVWAHVQR